MSIRFSALALLGLVLGSCSGASGHSLQSPAPALVFSSSATLSTHSVKVAIAATEATRAQGLSGQVSLAPDTGLALSYKSPAVVNIWMPDMNFPLDVIFVSNARITALYPKEPPCKPSGNCPPFGPGTPVNFVLEMPAGTIARYGLHPGDAASLSASPAP